MKRRLLAAVVVLGLVAAACGGDDDDDESSGGDGTEEASGGGGDFCEIWPSLNTGEGDDISDITPERVAEARALIDQARDAAPEEIEEEVGQFADAIENLLDVVADGEEPDEAMFGELFALALGTGPTIEEWLVENCPDYESESGFGGSSGSEFAADDFADGLLGVPGADVADMLNAAFPGGHYGYGGGGDDTSYDWEITVAMSADEAVAGCESFAEALAAHDDLGGTLTFRVRQYVEPVDDPDTEEVELNFEQGDVLVENAGISAGDPGSCEAA